MLQVIRFYDGTEVVHLYPLPLQYVQLRWRKGLKRQRKRLLNDSLAFGECIADLAIGFEQEKWSVFERQQEAHERGQRIVGCCAQ